MTYFHRAIFYSLLVGSLVWAFFALKMNPLTLIANNDIIGLLKLTYLLGFTVTFWPIVYVEICDLITSSLGRNGKLYKEYAKSVQKDVLVSLVAALLSIGIYWTDAVPYSFSGIDLGFAGIPFVIASIYAIVQMANLKVAGEPVRKAPLIVMLLGIAIYAAFALSVLRTNSSGEFETYQAIWFQVTILCSSFFIYTSTSLQLCFLQKGKFEISPFKLYFFREIIRSKTKAYENLRDPLNDLNKKMRKMKAKRSAQLRRKKKK